MNRMRWLLAGATVVTLALASVTVLAAGQSNEALQARKATVPPELTDKSWAERNPAAAPDLKKVQLLYEQDPAMGAQAAVSALGSAEPTVRAYAALVLGAVGTDEQLAGLIQAQEKEQDAGALEQLELAQVRIKHRLARGHAEKQVSVLAPAFKSQHLAVRAWAARELAASRSEAARILREQVLQFEQDESVRQALTGR